MLYKPNRVCLILLLQRPQPLSEMAMLEKMFIQSEKELFENDKKLVKESPGMFHGEKDRNKSNYLHGSDNRPKA